MKCFCRCKYGVYMALFLSSFWFGYALWIGTAFLVFLDLLTVDRKCQLS